MFDSDNLPPKLEEQDWLDFVQHRKEIKKPMTDTAKRRMLKKLYEMGQAGEPIAQCMERSMVNGWADVYCMPPDLRQSGRPQSHRDFEKEPEPEPISEEQAQDNVRRLHEAIDGTMKISGGRR